MSKRKKTHQSTNAGHSAMGGQSRVQSDNQQTLDSSAQAQHGQATTGQHGQPAQAQHGQPAKAKKGGKVLPALCNVFGILLLVAVIALCAPIAVPSLVGYEVFDVVSGSMEPEIHVGSIVYVKDVDPSTLERGDIVAYQEENGVIVHRVTTNRTSIGELVTKGDANEVEDFQPVPYDAVIGRMEAQVPMLGTFMGIYATFLGKLYLLLTAACGVMLNILASRMRKDLAARAATAERTGHASQGSSVGSGGASRSGDGMGADDSVSADDSTQAAKKRSRGSKLRIAAALVLGVVFLGSAGVIGYVNWQYAMSDALYEQATSKYTDPVDNGENYPPIDVDFKALKAENPDVVGWIYCAGTPIDYPIVQGRDNDQYLHADYTGAYNIDGSIFVDSDNRAEFVDANTIIYGHHMNSGSMFSCLPDWAEQSYFDKHSVIWLLTPEQDYKIQLFSAHHTDARSDMYEIIHDQDAKLESFLATSLAMSDVNSDVVPSMQGRYVMLSTCATYLFDNARYVLHGLLIPVS